MKLNLGCGQNKIKGFINVDKYLECNPDQVMDLEQFPWDFQSNTADEIVLNHVLEHLGSDTEVFFKIIKEIYRVCKNKSIVHINVPHPRHKNFINDPTHVRIITPEIISLFSKKNCLHWKKTNAANSPLALYLNVDMELIEKTYILSDKYMELFKNGSITKEELTTLIDEKNNIVKEIRMKVQVIKEES